MSAGAELKAKPPHKFGRADLAGQGPLLRYNADGISALPGTTAPYLWLPAYIPTHRCVLPQRRVPLLLIDSAAQLGPVAALNRQCSSALHQKNRVALPAVNGPLSMKFIATFFYITEGWNIWLPADTGFNCFSIIDIYSSRIRSRNSAL
jgi:hypothetical protein